MVGAKCFQEDERSPADVELNNLREDCAEKLDAQRAALLRDHYEGEEDTIALLDNGGRHTLRQFLAESNATAVN
jgi:hypothetical protein